MEALSELSSWDIWAIVAKLIVYAGCFLAIGSTLYFLATPQLNEDAQSRLKRLVVLSAIIAAIASLSQIGIQAGRLLDDGMAGMADPEMLNLVKDAPLGTAVFLRVLGLAVLIAFALSIPVAWLFGLLGAILTATSFSFVGHGTEEPRLLMGALVTVHLLGISFWIGALSPLRRESSGSSNIQQVGELAHRFGQQAAWVVGVLILAGGILAYRILGSVEVLFTSQYGLTLVAKVAIVSALLALAAANKLRFVPAMQRGDTHAALHLHRSIKWEMIAVGLILIITAVLTTITPVPETMEMTNG